jgi:hypothetical protein
MEGALDPEFESRLVILIFAEFLSIVGNLVWHSNHAAHA